MSEHIGSGIALVLIGGVLNGSFALPMKHMPAWRWENTWLPYSFVGMIMVPWMFAMATVPQLASVYHQATWPTLLTVALFGFGWGVGSTLFGLGIRRVGMALGFAIILGLTASLGSLLPLAVLHPQQLVGRQGHALITGMVLVVLGVVFCSIAGRRREREVRASAQGDAHSGFAWGLVICIFSGILSAMLNFSFVFGKELQQLTLSLGSSATLSANPIWSLALTAGFIANAGYCAYLLQRNRTWHVFAAPEIPVGYWLGAAVMGLVWFGGIAVYGMGAAALGALGGIVGWPLFMAMVIVAANLWGAVTGEWAGASRRSYAYSWAGIAALLLAIYVISRGGGT